jgi:aspartyl-tRNA(Asn)/glutamyl-tRNA(Gln) amidotransferase subunit C
MAVFRDDVLHIASLARLAIDESRVPELVRELNGILEHVDALAGVDTTGVEPVAGVGDAGQPLRADTGPAYPLSRPVEAIAPSMRDGFFLVPRLATHQDPDAEELE